MCRFAPDTRNCPEERCPALRRTPKGAITTCCGVTIPETRISDSLTRTDDSQPLAGEWRDPTFTANGGDGR